MSGNQQILANLIRARAATEPDLDVLTFVDVAADGSLVDEVRTYAQLWQNGQRIAAAMKALGMKAGDTFAMVMDNHAEFVDLMVASSILGTMFVPIDPRTRGDKLAFMLDFAECRGAVVADGALEGVREVWSSRADRWILPLERRPRSRCVHAPDPGRRPARACARGRKLGPRSHDADPVHVGDDRRPEGHPHHPRQVHDGQHRRRDPRAHPRRSSVHRAVADARQRAGDHARHRAGDGPARRDQPQVHQVAALGHHAALRLHDVQPAGRHDHGDLRRAAAQ